MLVLAFHALWRDLQGGSRVTPEWNMAMDKHLATHGHIAPLNRDVETMISVAKQ